MPLTTPTIKRGYIFLRFPTGLYKNASVRHGGQTTEYYCEATMSWIMLEENQHSRIVWDASGEDKDNEPQVLK